MKAKGRDAAQTGHKRQATNTGWKVFFPFRAIAAFKSPCGEQQRVREQQ